MKSEQRLTQRHVRHARASRFALARVARRRAWVLRRDLKRQISYTIFLDRVMLGFSMQLTMKAATSLLLRSIALISLSSIGYPADLKLINGEVITDAEVAEVSKNRLKWKSPTGMGTVALSELSAETLKELGIDLGLNEEEKAIRERIAAFNKLRDEKSDIKLLNFKTVNSGQFSTLENLHIALRSDAGIEKIALSQFPDEILSLLHLSREELIAADNREQLRAWVVSETEKEYFRRKALKETIEHAEDRELADLASLYVNLFNEQDAHLFMSPGVEPRLIGDDEKGTAIAQAKEHGYGSIGYICFSIKGDAVDEDYFEHIGKIVGADLVIGFTSETEREEVIDLVKTLYPGEKSTSKSTSTYSYGDATGSARTKSNVYDNEGYVGTVNSTSDVTVATSESTYGRTNVTTRESPTVTVEETVVKVAERSYNIVFLRKLRQ